MKQQLLLAITLIFSITAPIFAQTVTGEWYGIGDVHQKGEQSNYLSELVLKQKGNKVTGEYNYYFKSMSIVNTVTGTFDTKTRTLELKFLPVINYTAKSMASADCPMEGSFTLRVSKVESTLYGQFNPTYNYRYTCPAITIKFVKQLEEPKKIVPEKEDEPAPKPKAQVLPTPKVVKVVPAEVSALIKRGFDLPPVIEVDADSLKIALYDNGDVDNDTISLFYNRKLIDRKKMLSTKPLNYILPLDTNINEISMFAENLGLISPNTALAIIYAGEERFELNMTSTFIKNAAIRFRRKPKPDEQKIIK